MMSRAYQLHPVHRLIQALGRDEPLRARMAGEREQVYAEFGLNDREIAALTEGTIPALAAIGVHPMYRMHWMMLSNPDAAGYLSVREYIDKAQDGARHG